jgi:hypothetical protein
MLSYSWAASAAECILSGLMVANTPGLRNITLIKIHPSGKTFNIFAKQGKVYYTVPRSLTNQAMILLK